MRIVAHVSDTHFGNRPGVAERSRRVVDALLTIRPDVVVVTGDVADHGLPEEYAEARAVFAPWDGPLLWLPGNHDVRAAFARDLLGEEPPADDDPLHRAVDVAGLRFLLLDSLVTAPVGGRVDHGVLPESSLTWLAAELAAGDAPTFVALHHPPTPLGVSLMDPIRLRGPEPLAALVAAHPHVVATLVGHAHTAATGTFAGRPLLVGGGVCSTVPVDAERRPPVWDDAPPSFALHLLLDDAPDGDAPGPVGGPPLVTHWRSL